MNSFLTWLGIWSLAASWLLLLNYFVPADPRGWTLAATGTLLLIVAARRFRWQKSPAWIYWLALPLLAATLLWPLPYRLGPLLLLASLVVSLGQGLAPWLTPLSLGLALAGAAWIAQGGAAVAYWWLGARYHEVAFLSPLLQAATSVLGWPAGSSGGSLFLPHIEGVVQATATWERLGALPALLLAAGGLPLLPLVRRRSGRELVPNDPNAPPFRQAARRLLVGLVLGLGYLLLRYLALTAVVAIGREPTIFWLPPAMALSFLPLVLLLARVLPLAAPMAPRPSVPAGRPWPYVALVGLGALAGLAVVGLLASPDPGRKKDGRVLLDEYNSNWEWSTQALDTEWYGQKSGYNYYSLGQWLGYYFQVDTNFEPRTPQLLSAYDVLIIKTPTAAFAPDEIEAIEAWVRAGGGLFLIGDHTNVFGTSSYLNPLARRFGLRFRYDSTYDLATLRVTLYERPELLVHPALIEMPPFLFATSCTLEAPLLADSVMTGYGLRALPVDYSKRVFFPDKEAEQDYPFGLFLQSAAVHHGRGRVVAFTDSTVFSNFTMFLAGKSEYFLGVMNWLNYAERWPWLDGLLMAVGLLAAAGCLFLARSLERQRAMVAVLGGLLVAAAVGPWLCLQLARARYPLPEPHSDYVRIAFEGEHSRLRLPTTPSAGSPEASYQTFYVWTQRLGYVPSFDNSLEEALTRGQVVVVVDPFRPFAPSELEAIEAFVARGGRLLLLGEPRQEPLGAGTANQVLALFGLELQPRATATGTIYNSAGEGLSPLQVGGVLLGGEPLLRLEGRAPIAAQVRHGQGLVAAVALARTFNDRAMGNTAVRPTAHQRFLYEIEFWLLRGLVDRHFPPLRPQATAGP